MTNLPAELGPREIYRACDAASLAFETTANLDDLTEIIGQERAVTSVDFGMDIDSDGYNIFAVGPNGTGKSTTVYDFLKRKAASLPAPDDWMYVYNFAKPSQPNAVRLPAGQAQNFKKSMEKLVEDLQAAITRAFESEEYEKQKRQIAQQVGEQQEAKLGALNQKADAQGFMIVRTPAGLAFAPKGEEAGEPMSREKYEALPAEEQKRIDDGLEALNEELQGIMRLVRQDERGGRDAMRELDQKVAEFAARHLIDEACEQWCHFSEMAEYLKAVLKDVVENADDFKKSDEEAPMMFMGMPIPQRPKGEGAFNKYRINVIVDNSELQGAPVISESNPILQNLVGRVEHQAQFGALFTDFTMIKGGALHAANGGFLVLDARDLLLKPYAWDGLKRTLKNREIRIEDITQQLGLAFATTATLDPEPIPFKAKIVMIGEPYVYYLLYSMDPDFEELFKVKADFDNVVDRTPDNEKLYARFIGRVARDHDLPPFSADAAGRVIEQTSRMVEDQRKMTTKFADVHDLLSESAYWAKRENHDGGAPVVEREHVQKAIDQRIYRSNRIEERVREMIADATVMVDTQGAVVGQINGLSVSSIGDYMFGRPSRITATHRLGEGEVVDIEREVEMGGPIHSKGVLILAGYLGAKYASDRPLSLTARLVFEQSYSGVEGDSASSAELYALLSSLSGVPIQQRFAVTGSVNQRGQVQAIGGVNEKIEGFYEVCEALGLKGDESVLIPRANVPHLMLKPKVREAIEAGRFHIYPVTMIDEGIGLLTGMAAGEAQEDGTFLEGTINRKVVDRLNYLAEKARELARRKGKEIPDHLLEHTTGDSADEK
jgi:lon-related putative ATP-dependent protease